MAAAAATRDVEAENRYLRRRENPWSKGASLEEVAENKLVSFVDARTANGGLGSWQLDTHGFTCVPPPLPAVDFLDRERTIAEYCPRLVEQAKQMTGAKHGFFYFFLTRGPDAVWHRFSSYPHSDFGASAVPKWRKELVERFGLPEEEAKDCNLLMLNCWHPFQRPAYRDPLCLLDFSTLSRYEDEVVPIPGPTVNFFYPPEQRQKGPKELRDGTFVQKSADGTRSESLLVGPVFSPKHRWVFISDQKPEEAWWFKQYDTRPNVATCAFHSSFPDPFHAKDPTIPSRLSVEFRVLLSFPKKEGEEKTLSKL